MPIRRLLVALSFLLVSTPAFAQKHDPLPPFVVDIRATFATLKQDPLTATSLGITTADLANHGLGFVAGAQLYPLRRGGFALGLGGEMLMVHATQQNVDPDTMAVGPKVHRTLQSMSGQLSFNFGHRQGWSYFSAGFGPVGFDTYIDGTEPDGLRAMSTNYGFGARWFNTEHLAFILDLRFYSTAPANPTTIVGGRQRESLLVISAGLGIK